MTDQDQPTQPKEAREEEPPRSRWELMGSPPRQEIVFVDEEGELRFPDTPKYRYPSPDQAERVRSGKTVYADEALVATQAAVRRAGELGVDLHEIEGTGKGSQVKIEDVEAHASSAGAREKDEKDAPPLEVDEDEGAFWQLAEDAVLYYDGSEAGAFLRPGEEGYEPPPDDVLARLDSGERVYVEDV